MNCPKIFRKSFDSILPKSNLQNYFRIMISSQKVVYLLWRVYQGHRIGAECTSSDRRTGCDYLIDTLTLQFSLPVQYTVSMYTLYSMLTCRYVLGRLSGSVGMEPKVFCGVVHGKVNMPGRNSKEI